GNVDELLAQQDEPELTGTGRGRISLLVPDEVVDELGRTLGRIDATDVEKVRISAEAEPAAECIAVAGALGLHSDTDDLAGRGTREPVVTELPFLRRQE